MWSVKLVHQLRSVIPVLTCRYTYLGSEHAVRGSWRQYTSSTVLRKEAGGAPESHSCSSRSPSGLGERRRTTVNEPKHIRFQKENIGFTTAQTKSFLFSPKAQISEASVDSGGRQEAAEGRSPKNRLIQLHETAMTSSPRLYSTSSTNPLPKLNPNFNSSAASHNPS